MFTGIVTDVGTIIEVGGQQQDRRIVVETRLPLEEIPHGGSIATSGICFTVVEKGRDWFALEASGATLEVTTAGDWRAGDRVNLERSLRIGDELGGHIVFGHVDGIGEIRSLAPVAESWRLEVGMPPALAPLIAVKGSIAVDGVSLTVNEAETGHFAVNLIPHTLRATNFGRRAAGERVNIEVDMLARYVARQLAFRSQA